MLHLRALCPPERTDQVLAALDSQPGAAHVVVLRGAVVGGGDVVEADVAREATDDVIGALCELDIDHTGGITLEMLTTALSDAADRAEAAAPGDGADAVVWQDLINRTGDESRLSATFFAFLTISCLLAGVGVVTDSAVTIVGAMVVSPDFGPLAALAVGLVRRRSDLLRRGLLALGLGFPAAIALTVVATLGARLAGVIDGDPFAGGLDVDFIAQVGPASFVIALLAGAAGMLSLTSAKPAALVGVFISVTTIPAAGYAAVSAVFGEWARCGASILQLGLNIIGVVTAASLVLWLRRRGADAPGTERPLGVG